MDDSLWRPIQLIVRELSNGLFRIISIFWGANFEHAL